MARRPVRADWYCQDCRVLMLYDAHNDRHVCPRCYAELWHKPDDDPVVEDEITQLMREMYKANLPAKEPIPAGRAARGGGGSKVKGRKKTEMKKKSVKQLFSEL